MKTLIIYNHPYEGSYNHAIPDLVGNDASLNKRVYR